MFNEDKLRDMVIDLKLGESSESFEEMLEKVSQDNRLYGELVKTSKKETIDKTIEVGLKKLQDKEILEKGDTVVLSSGSKMLENSTESKIIGGVVRI